MKTITYTIVLTFDEEDKRTSLTIGDERYVQIKKGYWCDGNGTPMHQALCEMAETWITRNGEDAS